MKKLELLPAKENKNMIQTFCINNAIPHTLVHFKDPNFSRDNSLCNMLKGNEKRRTDVTVLQTDYLKPWKQTLDLMYTPVLTDRNNRYGPQPALTKLVTPRSSNNTNATYHSAKFNNLSPSRISFFQDPPPAAIKPAVLPSGHYMKPTKTSRSKAAYR